MSFPISPKINLVEQFPNLLHKDGHLLKVPSTVTELRAANQFLRGQTDFVTSITDSNMSIKSGKDHGILTCKVSGKPAHAFSWGATVEGITPEQDVVEPHLVLNPSNEGVVLHYESPYDPINPDVAVYGFIEGEGGKSIPLVGPENELGAMILKDGSGDIHLFKDGKSFAISVAPELTTDSGQLTYLSPDNLSNLTVGGIHLIFIRGKMKIQPNLNLSESFTGFDLKNLGNLPGLNSRDFGMNKSMGMPSPSAAAHAGYGKKVGTSTEVDFIPDLSTSQAAFVRLRVDRSMPPLMGTKEWVAWKNSQEEIRNKYNAIVCNSCGNQAGPNQATMENGSLHVHAGCSGCGAHSFGVVTGYARKEK